MCYKLALMNGGTGPAKKMRSSARFPLKLAVVFKTHGIRNVDTETTDISAGGVMFYANADVIVGSSIEFDIVIPAAAFGAEAEVRVECAGRVVRCSYEGDRRAIAAVIDEYRFERGKRLI